jgi:hypothetical protein
MSLGVSSGAGIHGWSSLFLFHRVWKGEKNFWGTLNTKLGILSVAVWLDFEIVFGNNSDFRFLGKLLGILP